MMTNIVQIILIVVFSNSSSGTNSLGSSNLTSSSFKNIGGIFSSSKNEKHSIAYREGKLDFSISEGIPAEEKLYVGQVKYLLILGYFLCSHLFIRNIWRRT